MNYEEVLQVLTNYNEYVKNVCKKTAEDYPVCEVYADLREGYKTIDSFVAQCNGEAKQDEPVQAPVEEPVEATDEADEPAE